MLTVFKYPIQPNVDKNFRFPLGFKPLRVGMQKLQLCLWVLIDEEEKRSQTVRLCVVRTGGMVPSGMDHVGSCHDGAHMAHVFVGKEKAPT